MLRNCLKRFTNFKSNSPWNQYGHVQSFTAMQQTTEKQATSYREINMKSKFNFSRRLFRRNKPIHSESQIQEQKLLNASLANSDNKKSLDAQTSKVEEKAKVPYFKETQNYTFTDLQKDLETYQQYLEIFNTHTKKPHQKLLKNQIKIIQLIINSKRDDLINKFLSVNYRNRLANPQTLVKITQYCVQKIINQIDSIMASSVNCQGFLQTITLLTEYNQIEAFSKFIQQINKKKQFNFFKQNQNYLINLLKSFPSAECQFLTLYNFLFRQKQLPLYLMKSQFFGIHTENLKFHNLGETFYEIRKFMRRYFAFYSQRVDTVGNGAQFNNFQRSKEKLSNDSSLENDVSCFLKTLNYHNVRKQIQIDGFVVDFVIDGVIQKKVKKPATKQIKQPQKQAATSTILEVMGSYHYTSTGKLKGRDVRKLILLGSKYRKRRYNVKLIHYDDFNKSRGFRNKMELIRAILQESGTEINWQQSKKGYDSQWQLKEHYEEFK